MRKPRLSKKTIETLFHEGKAYSGKYEYELTRDWSDEYNTYIDHLTRWDQNNNYGAWTLGTKGLYEFEKR